MQKGKLQTRARAPFTRAVSASFCTLHFAFRILNCTT